MAAFNLKFNATLDTSKIEAQIAKLQSKEINIGKNASKDMDGLANSTKKASQSFTDILGKVTKFGTAAQVIRLAKQGFSAAITEIQNLDKSITELQKVTDSLGSSSALSSFLDGAYDSAKELSASITDVVDATTTFVKTGLDVNLAQQYAEVAIAMQKTADGAIEADTVAESLIATMRAWGMEGQESAVHVGDAINAVSANFAISSNDILNNMQKVSSVMAVSGTSFEESLGLLVGGSEITRNVSTMSNALRTISQRIRGVGEDAEAGLTGKLQPALDSIGASVQIVDEQTGEMASTYEILGAIAERWGSLTDAQKQNIGELAAGKTRITQFNALMENWGRTVEATAQAMDSFGYTEKQLAIETESISGKIQNLKTTFSELVTGLSQTDVFKNLIDLGTKIGEVLLGDTDIGDLGSYASNFIESLISFIIYSVPDMLPTMASIAVQLAGSLTESLIVNAPKILFKFTEALIQSSSAVMAQLMSLGESMAQSISDGFMRATDQSAGTSQQYVSDSIDRFLLYGSELSSLENDLADAQARLETQRGYLSDIADDGSDTIGTYDELIGKVDSLWEKIQEFDESDKAQLEAKEAFLVSEDYRNSLEEISNMYSALAGEEVSFGDLSSAMLSIEALDDISAEFEGTQESVQSAMKDTEQEIENIQSRIETVSALYEQAGQEVYGVLEKLATGEITASEAAEQLSTSEESVAEAFRQVYGESYKGLDYWEKYYSGAENAAYVTGEVVESAEELLENQQEVAQVFNEVYENINKARLALKEYNDAQSEGEKGDEFKSYAKAYQDFLEAYNAGMVGASDVIDFARVFLPDEILYGELQGNYAEAGKMIADTFWQNVFAGGGEDYGAAFVSQLYDMADANGKVIDSNGQVVASFQKVGDTVVGFTVDDVDGLARELNTVPGVIEAVNDAFGVWGQQVEYTRDEIKAMAEATGNLKAASEEAIEIDLEGMLSDIYKSGELTKSQMQDLYDSIITTDGVTFENLEGGFDALYGKLEETYGSQDEVKTALQELNDQEANPEVEIDNTQALNAIQEVDSRLNSLDGRRATTYIDTIESTTQANAKGTKNAKEGLSLVNEEGAELIVSGGEAYIAGGGKPTITKLHAGDEVYTAKQTKEILQGIQSFASGTTTGINWSQIQQAAYDATGGKVGSVSSATSSASSSAASSYSGSSSGGGSSSSDMTEAEEEEKKRLEDIVALRVAELALMEERGDSIEDQIAKIEEIKDAIKAEEEYLRSIGGDEKDIVKLETDWYRYTNKINDLLKEMKDEAADWFVEQIDKEIDLLKKQNEELEDRLELEKALQELEEAKAKKGLIYQNGQWVYGANVGDVAQATAKLDDVIRNQKLDEQIELLESIKDSLEDMPDEFMDLYKVISSGGSVDYSSLISGGVGKFDDEYLELLNLLRNQKILESGFGYSLYSSYRDLLSGIGGYTPNSSSISDKFKNSSMPFNYSVLGSDFQKMNRDYGTVVNQSFGNISLPNVTNAESFVKELKNFSSYAKQEASKR